MRDRFRPSTYYKVLPKKVFNRTLHTMARLLGGGKRLRPFLHRLRGVKIYGRVYIGDDVYIDESHPDSVEIHEDVVIAHRCTIIGHTRGVGKIVIEKKVAIASGCLIVCAPGRTLTIGEGSVISAGSIVSHDIPPHTLCGQPRIRAFGEVTVPFTIDTTYQEFRRGLLPLRGKEVR